MNSARIAETAKTVDQMVESLLDNVIQGAATMEDLAVRLQLLGLELAEQAGRLVGTRIAAGFLVEEDADDTELDLVERLLANSQLRAHRSSFDWQGFARAATNRTLVIPPDNCPKP